MFFPNGKLNSVQVLHQVTAGFVKILLGGKAGKLEYYRDKSKDEPISDLEVQSTGKSIGLALPTPEINPITESFSASRDRAIEAMEALTKLLSLAESRGDI